MNSKQAVERMREIEKRLSQGIAYDWDKFSKQLKQEAKEISEKFKDGCDEMWMTGVGAHYPCKGNCPNCQEIKEIWERLKDENN